MNRLEGKVAIVTGAGRVGNIGLAIIKAFLREGCRGVVATDMRTDQFDVIRSALSDEFEGDRFRLDQHDVTDEGDWARVVDSTVEAFGGIDVLVNNAGISVHGGIESTKASDLRRVMAVNHDSLLFGIQACLPALLESHKRFPGGGSIINEVLSPGRGL
ncbi:SDR family NAD(P)-dependent oxidoreductase [Rhodococcus pyridinivorans]|uniref:SDR family NAD(P)-dependent oxidoreductase n=1 Tax=Rhodococcus pyridinivorans TaxID=103816 RepID=UPI0009BCF4E5|nr:SDR family NAD(P)-dependent oxidoreductase [Rhodococcus pyridinivorans]